MYLASKDMSACFAIALHAGQSKPELFCHSPSAGLRWGLSPEILTHGTWGVTLYMSLHEGVSHQQQEQIKAQDMRDSSSAEVLQGLQLH